MFFWQLPEPSWVDALQKAKIPFFVTARTSDAIDGAAELPSSGLVLQGIEVGGHVRSELPRNSAVVPMRGTTGDFDLMCLAAGQSVERIHDVKPAAEIVSALFDGWWRQ